MKTPKEEYWTQRDGTKIAVGDMDIDHLRNTLRMIIRNSRRQDRPLISTKYDEMSGIDEEAFEMFPAEDYDFERPDNHQVLAELKAQHGDAVRVEREGIAGMSGGNVYINGEWYGWLGGI